MSTFDNVSPHMIALTTQSNSSPCPSPEQVKSKTRMKYTFNRNLLKTSDAVSTSSMD